MIVVNGVSYPIDMYGAIHNNQLMFEMFNQTEESAAKIFANAVTIIYINSDGVPNDFSRMKFVGFMDGAAPGNVRVVLK